MASGTIWDVSVAWRASSAMKEALWRALACALAAAALPARL